MSGCYTAPSTVTLNPAKVPSSSTRRDGNVALKLEDGRADKTSVGKLSGRMLCWKLTESLRTGLPMSSAMF